MNVNDIYNLVLYICSKNLQQGYISPDDFNITINIAQKSYAAYLLGNFQQYTPGRPVARVEFGQNTIIRQRLSPIIYGYILNIGVDGKAQYPGDYLQTDAMWSVYGYQRIRAVQQNYLWAVYGSSIDPIATNPIYLIEDDGFQFFPINIGQTRLSYIRNPPNMVWGYTLDINGLPVYDPSNSTQPVWDEASILEIIIRALAMIGVSLQFEDVKRYAAEIKNIGQ